jgi:hypothetical protein
VGALMSPTLSRSGVGEIPVPLFIVDRPEGAARRLERAGTSDLSVGFSECRAVDPLCQHGIDEAAGSSVRAGSAKSLAWSTGSLPEKLTINAWRNGVHFMRWEWYGQRELIQRLS